MLHAPPPVHSLAKAPARLSMTAKRLSLPTCVCSTRSSFMDRGKVSFHKWTTLPRWGFIRALPAGCRMEGRGGREERVGQGEGRGGEGKGWQGEQEGDCVQHLLYSMPQSWSRLPG